ncbi:hypothetical protein GCM10009090_27090 [[Pseudomonas] boreopolis]|uniref:Phasin domain-containing protein n=2 Tax=Xanthomonas boreopolis TaxID=86183 RepID=A0A919F9K3_9XANT|nr:hypothetical protein GCM10009090_27090 [[Pseudomonas] boreopolis]
MLHRNTGKRSPSGLKMSAQFEGFDRYTQQFAAIASRANRLALENAESAFGLQLQAFGRNVSATTDFLGEFADARNLDSLQALWPKGLQLARDNFERVASVQHEVVGMSLKASEAIGELARQRFEDASGRVQARKPGKAGRSAR